MGGKVVVIGGSGWLGRQVCRQLALATREILVVDRRLPPLYVRDVASFVQPDGRDLAYMPVGDVECVVQLAASPVSACQNSRGALLNDYIVTLDALEMARRTEARFVYASSTWVWATRREARVHDDEMDPALPNEPFAASKLAGEALASAFAGHHHVPATALRLALAYGPDLEPRGMPVMSAICKALGSDRVAMHGHPDDHRVLVHVTDMAAAIVRAALAEHTGFRAVTVAADPVRQGDLLEYVFSALGVRPEVEWLGAPPGEFCEKRFLQEHTRSVLAWEPRVPLGRGVAEYVLWLKSTGRLGALQG